MESINKSAAIIRPKRAFITWANSSSIDGFSYSPEYFNEHAYVILSPIYDSDTTAKLHLTEIWETIFTEMLRNWNPDEFYWPKERTSKMFWQWFGVEFQLMVAEMNEEE